MELRKVLTKHIPQARQVLAKMMSERLTFKPEMRRGRRGYRFTGRGTLMPLLSGLVPELSEAVASPNGTVKGCSVRFEGIAALMSVMLEERESE